MARKKQEVVGYQIIEDYRDKIVEGLVIANYRELSELLGVKYTTSSDSREAYKKVWRTYFKWIEQGYKYIITEVYEVPLPKEKDLRVDNGNEGIYANHIEAILCNALASIEKLGRDVTYTRLDWLRMVGVCEVNYKLQADKIYNLEKKTDITQLEIIDFMKRIERNLWGSFEGVLMKLKKSNLITYNDVICYSWEKDTPTKKAKIFYSTLEEYDVFREMLLEHLVAVGCEKENELYTAIDPKTNKRVDIEEFYDILKEDINGWFGWAKYYRAVTIRYTTKQVERYLDRHQLRDEKITLNGKVIVQALISADKRHEENIDLFRTIQDEIDDYISREVNGYGTYDRIEKAKSINPEKGYDRYGMKYYFAMPDYPKHAEIIANYMVMLHEAEQG